MRGLQSQPKITNYLSDAMRIKSERPGDTSMANDSSPHPRAQTQAHRARGNSEGNTAARAILQPGQDQLIDRSEAGPGMSTEKQLHEGMEPQEHRSLRSGPRKNSSTNATQRRAKRTRDELRELADAGDAEAAAELEAILENGRDYQKRRKEQAAAGIPWAVASKEKDRQRSRDLSALRSSTAQLQQQIDNGDKAAVGALQLLKEGYLAKYPKSHVFKGSSAQLGTTNSKVAFGSLQSSRTQKRATKKPTKRKAAADAEEGNKTQKQPTKKPAKRKAIADDEEGNKTHKKVNGKRLKRKLVVDDSEDDDEAVKPKKRVAQPKAQENLVDLPVQEEEVVAPKLRWHKGRTIRSSHDQHGKSSPGGATPDYASAAAPNGTDTDVETEAIVHEPQVPQIEDQEKVAAAAAVIPQPVATTEQTIAAPTIQPPAANNNQIPPPDIINVDDPDVEFVKSRPIFNNTSMSTMGSIYRQLGAFSRQQDHEDDVEYTKLQIRKKEIEEEKIELQLKLRRQQRAQAVQQVSGSRSDRVKAEMTGLEGPAKVE